MLSKGDDAVDRHNTVKKEVLPPKDNEADNKVDTNYTYNLALLK